MPEIELFSWNPDYPLPTRLGPRIPWRRPINNFGDLLGPVIVRAMLKREGLVAQPKMSARLLSVGSVLHFAQDGDVIWGSGVNGAVSIESHTARILDVRAVRGPRTRSFLMDRGIVVPEVYGDPALLLPLLMPELLSVPKRYAVTVVPNFNDLRQNPAWRLSPKVLNPSSGLAHCLQRIAASEFVVGSSLHGIIVAEALGIPARLVKSAAESDLKYADYYEATGRADYSTAQTVREATAAGGEKPPVFSPAGLMAAFPVDLWLPLQRPSLR